MAEKVLLAKHGKTFKIWGADVFTNDTTGESEATIYFGRIGLQMHQLQHRKKQGGRELIWEIRDTFMEKTQGEYTAVPNGEYFALVEKFHEDIEQLIKKYRGW